MRRSDASSRSTDPMPAAPLSAAQPPDAVTARRPRRHRTGRRAWAEPVGGLVDVLTAAATVLAVTWLPLQRLVPPGIGWLEWVLQITVLAAAHRLVMRRRSGPRAP